MEPEKPKINRTNLILMIVIIVLFLVGIFLRREYILKELSDTIQFYKERISTP